jgi:hypothetical protein
MKKSPHTNFPSEYVTIKGQLLRVSPPNEFNDGTGRVSENYYYLGIKTSQKERYMVFVTTTALGWGGNFNLSKVWYFNSNRNREMKTSMANPELFIGKTLQVTGYKEIIDTKSLKYRMNRVQKIVIFIEEEEFDEEPV